VKILLVNNFYYNRGGDCTYLFSLKKLLEEKGHKVIVFSMHHPRNFKSEYSKYFVSHVDYAEESRNMSISSGFRVLFRSIYSTEARKKMEKLIKDEKPDIVHLNNIRHHLTPSILYPVKAENIPIVWTLHDYQLICPNISFLAGGRICERCKKRKYYWPPLVRCKKDSLPASTMAAIEHTAQWIFKMYDLVDVFICPSEFLRNKFIEYGFQEKKLVLLNHFVDINEEYSIETDSDYLLYIGRLSEEKGIRTLIDTVVKLNAVKLKIAGDGPLKEELLIYADSRDKNKVIEFVGHKDRKEIIKLLKNCRFLIFPSEWYEVSGLVILEAFACGKPVIGSRIGGIPELIKDNVTGLTFEPCNSDDLSEKIEYLNRNPEKITEMGRNARSFVEQDLNGEKHYEMLIDIYKANVH